MISGMSLQKEIGHAPSHRTVVEAPFLLLYSLVLD